jgi:hypothetical protein
MHKNVSLPHDSYYWAEQDPEKLIGYLTHKIHTYYQFLDRSGLFRLMEESHRVYYGGLQVGSQGGMFDSANLVRGGKQGELTLAKANHYSNVVDHTVQLTTSTKPAFQGRAVNSDHKSMSQAILGTCIVDYYWHEASLANLYVEGCQWGMRYGEAAVHRPWDKGAGNAYVANPETGSVVKEGDLKFELLSPTDVVRDTTRKNTESDWYIVRSEVNRWDLIARNPQLKDDLLKVDSTEFDRHQSFCFRISKALEKNSDYVNVWTAYHRKTDAMPEGRLFVFCGDAMLYDGPIPYQDLPLDFIRPRQLSGTPFGFSPAWHLLGVQQVIDILTSTIVTNQSTNGLNNLWTKANDPIAVASLPGGMKNLMSETKPEVIQLVMTAPEIFEFRKSMIAEMETLSGINSTVRGNPEASLKSGNSLALIVAQATQFAGMLEGSLQEAQENTATGIIISLRDFSRSKRVANIVGAANRSFRKEFTPEKDLASIQRIVLEPVNPLSKTISGRLELANNLQQQGLTKTPEQYLTVLRTGQLDPALESSGSFEMLNIRAEGEYLQEGKPLVAIISDQHLTHIREHLALLATPEAREDPQFVARVLQHVQEHEGLWLQLSMRPALLMATNQQPAPPPPMPAGPPPGPGAPPSAVTQPPQGPGEENMPGQPSLPQLPPNAPPESQAAYDKATSAQGPAA